MTTEEQEPFKNWYGASRQYAEQPAPVYPTVYGIVCTDSLRTGLPDFVCDRGNPLAAKTMREASYKYREAILRRSNIR